MSRKTDPRGYFAIGVYHPKTEANIGTLMRSAYLYQAAFVFTIGRRYVEQASDTPKTQKNIPLFHFDTIDDFVAHIPSGVPLVGVELDDRSEMLHGFKHPERAVYVLGAEDHGLPKTLLDRCHHILQIESVEEQSMNVSTAGSIALWDRHVKRMK